MRASLRHLEPASPARRYIRHSCRPNAPFEGRREALIEILSLENGKVRSEAAFEVDMIPSKSRYWASVILTDYSRALEVFPGHFSVVTRSAIGVAGIIVPFNSPLVLTVRSLAPALAAGVTTVIKLPGNTAQTNFLFSNVLAEAGDLPKGVIKSRIHSINEVWRTKGSGTDAQRREENIHVPRSRSCRVLTHLIAPVVNLLST
jgi:acyl-CoA reductase-like NAD-dependent aldehyde dehydrogenase